MKKKTRIDYIDVLRGIGIMYMVLGHINLGVQFDHYIHAFHMPLFFFVTGFFFKRQQVSFKTFIKKTSKQLLLPYFIWGVAMILFAGITKLGLSTSLSQAVCNLFTTNHSGLPIAGALWYLTCLYFSQLWLYFLNKYFKKEWLFGIGCLAVFVMGLTMHYFHIELWWSIVNSFVAVGIVYFGYLIRKLDVLARFTNTNIIYTLILFIISTFSIMHTGYVNMRTGIYPNIILFFVNLLLAILFYSNVSKILLSIKKLSWMTEKIKYIGENSIVSLCLNQFVILLCSFVLQRLHVTSYLLTAIGMPLLLYNLLFFGLVMFILYGLTKLFMKTKLRILFGK